MHPNEQGGVYMGFKGSVGTDEKCPKCNSPFERISMDDGFLCRQHLTHPKRFWISAKALGIPNKLYSDRLGNVFDSYQAAMNQWTAMNTAHLESRKPKGKPWNPDDWIAGKVREQHFNIKAMAFIETKRPLYDRKKLSKSRWQGINNIINVFLIPFFTDSDIRYINKDDLKRFYLHLLDLRDKDDNPYADSYIKEILALLRSIFLEYRPADMPDFPAHTIIPKREKQWLGIERQLAIEPHIPERFKLAIRTLQTTGMRPGELRALQVSDMIDGALKVWKAFGDHGLRLSRKSGGEVTYPVPLDLWRSLQSHVEGKKADELIFCTKDGKPLHENTLFKVWKRACKNAGVKYIPLYQASRHSMASQIMADAKQKAIEEIQAKLGHFNKQTQKAYVIE
jgi:integrase